MNEPPTFLESNPAQRTIAERSAANTAVGIPVIAEDPDAGDSATISMLSDPSGLYSISASGQITTKSQLPATGGSALSHTITVQATDSSSSVSTLTVEIQLVDLNDPPVYSDAAFSVPELSPVNTHVGTHKATDPDASDVLRYSISAGNTGGAFKIDDSTGQITVANPVLDHEGTPTYSLTVVAADSRDSGSLSTQSTVTISVSDVNEGPVFNSATRVVEENVARGTNVGAPITASDPEGAALTYSIIGGDPNSFFAIGTTTGQITMNSRERTLDYEGTSEFSLEVQARDPFSLVATAVVKIFVEDVNDKPAFPHDSLSLNVREDAEDDDDVGGAVVATDQDGDTLSYSIVDGNGDGRFTIDSQSGQIMVAAPLDFEQQGGSQYTITVEASDGNVGGQTDVVVNIAVLDVNEPPVVTSATVEVDEGVSSGAVHSMVASDPDAGDFVTFRITDGNVGDVFVIAPSSGVVSLQRALDFESRSQYVLKVEAVDSNELSSNTAQLTVNVQDVNEPPSLPPTTLEVFEDGLEDVEVGAALNIQDPDADASHTVAITGGNSAGFFKMEGTQVLLAKSGLDYDDGVQTFSLTVLITDNGGLTSFAAVTVNVLDVNEPPVLEPASMVVPENSPVNFKVGSPLTASDPDAGQLVTFRIVGGDSLEVFKINACDGQIQVNRQVLDYEGGPKTYSLTVEVQDDAPPVPGPARLTATATVTITVVDVNEAPVVTAETFHVDENSNADTVVGTIAVNDEDAGQTHSFSILDGNAGNAFKVSNAGVVAVQAKVIDFELRDEYILTVRISDSGSPALSTVTDVRVVVSDVNEAPSFPPATRSVVESAAPFTLFGDALVATDVDAGQSLSFTKVDTTPNPPFDVTPAGRLYPTAALDYETTSSYQVLVAVEDDGLESQAVTTTITVGGTLWACFAVFHPCAHHAACASPTTRCDPPGGCDQRQRAPDDRRCGARCGRKRTAGRHRWHAAAGE